MKHYKMASVINPSIIKQPLRVVEIPLNKFSEEVIPHHQKMYEEYKVSMQKLIVLNNTGQLQREVKEKKRTIKQLRDLMYELDTLRTQVKDDDLDHFDSKTLSLRKLIITLINGYLDWEKKVTSLKSFEKENMSPFEGASQLQMTENLEIFKLKKAQDYLYQAENIQKDVDDLQEIYQNLNEMVGVQGEHVDHIHECVENTQQNIESGTKDLAKAHKLKAVAYPVTGACLGGMIGGPVGFIAGIKIGGIAAIGCAIAGYTGGRFLNRIVKVETTAPEGATSKTENSPKSSERKDK